ncbi:MAG TPA: BlaI/MecI/CopY family transcriptional regulator [Arenimonas sp.]|nr:BlaI/MecI/CopY family transcriptional regulator [Arenimonas sp.]
MAPESKRSPDGSGEDIALSELQLDVMRVLWRGEASVADVASALADSRGLAHTTVATVLTRLGRRGVVAARRDGRQLFYRATVSEPQVRRSMVGDLVQNLFKGDPRALLAHLVSESEVAPDDLEQVRALLAAQAAKPGKSS